MSITSSTSSSSSTHIVNNDHCSHTSSSDSPLSVTISAQQQDCHSSTGLSLLKPMATNSVKLKAISGGMDTDTNTLAPAVPVVVLPASRSKSGRKQSNSSLSSSSSNLLKEKLLPCKDRQYDPDKHCGVQTDSMDKACTRSLTCKTHSLTARRQVTSRSKPFDDLLEEHRVAKEEALRLAGKEVKLTKKQIRQREQEAKKALTAQKQESKHSTLSPGSSCQASPASSPSVAGSSRHLSSSSLPSPGAPSVSLSSPSAACLTKQSLQNNLTARIRRKEKEELQQSEVRVKLETDSSSLPPLTPIRNNVTQPLILRQTEKQTRYEGPDGIHYISHPPRPLAVNTYNTRYRNLTNSRSLDPSSISSPLYSRSSDPIYAAMTKVFQINTQENSVSVTVLPGNNNNNNNSQSTSKSKKKRTSTNSATSNNSNPVSSLKQRPSETSSCSVQSSSDLDASGTPVPPLVTSCLPSNKKSMLVSSSASKNNNSSDQISSKKRPAAKSTGASYPTLKSMLDAGLTSSPSLTPSPVTLTSLPSNGGHMTEALEVSPVTKRLRTCGLLSGSTSPATASTYGLSDLSLEKLLDAGIGKSGMQSLASGE